MKKNLSIPKNLLKRLPHYHYYLQQLEKRKRDYVSNTRLALDLRLTSEQVREDLENLLESLSISEIHSVQNLLGIVESYLGDDQINTAVLVGAGNLGRALLNSPDFKSYGLDILAIFDIDNEITGKTLNEKEIFHVDRLEELSCRLKVHLGIISTPSEPAQEIADRMVQSGILGIWNFTQARISVPKGIYLRNTSLLSDYLWLTQKIAKKYKNTLNQMNDDTK